MLRTLGHHLAAIVLLGATALLTTVGKEEFIPGTLGTRGFGYGALVLLGAALSIGPLARLAPALFARLLPFRRAVGVWSAVGAVVHLLYVLKLVERYNLTLVTMFLKSHQVPAIGKFVNDYYLDVRDPMTGHVVLLAWTGGVALVILAALALISNDRAQRWLGQSTWKLIQQQAYTAFLFVALHVLIMAVGNKLKGTLGLLTWAPWFLLAVAALQAAGFVRTVWKQRSRKPPRDRAAAS